MPDPKHVLIVEDEKDLAELLGFNLRKQGYLASVAHTGRRGLELATQQPPDLILLDVMLPELSGTEVAGRLRADPRTSEVPIIMLTAKGEEVDQLVGLAVGADDYIVKPFSMKILLARVEAVMRRAGAARGEERLLRLGGVEVNLETHGVKSEGHEIKLTLTEFRLLATLIQAGGRVLSRDRLMSKAMGPGVTVTERTIDVHMTAVRKKLGGAGSIIKTVRGVGYRVAEGE